MPLYNFSITPPESQVFPAFSSMVFQQIVQENIKISLLDQTYITVRDGKAVDFDWDQFIHTITRMKPAPAFDALDLSSPENEEFGTDTIKAAHFTAFSLQHSECNGGMALLTVTQPLQFLSF